MRLVDHAYRTMYSELGDRCLDAAFSTEFPVEGRFVPVEVKGRRYWYYDSADGQGGKARKYVGPADDPDIGARVERFKDVKADARARRRLVSTLVREAYLPRPDGIAGDIIQALAEGGLFRLRGVLVGSVAFSAYPALLGARLPSASMQTGDADFAQFHSISAAVGDAMPPVLEILQAVDPTFRDVPHAADGRRSTRFESRSGYRVEFLTPNTGSADRDGRPASMPALGGAAAEPLRFLDFLIHQPVRATILHGAGVPVLVPAPARFAVHKMIVSTRRRSEDTGAAKSDKDLAQADALIDAMLELRLGADVADAWMEAWDRGPSWREALTDGLARLAGSKKARTGLAEGVTGLDADPGDYGLQKDKTGLSAGRAGL